MNEREKERERERCTKRNGEKQLGKTNLHLIEDRSCANLLHA